MAWIRRRKQKQHPGECPDHEQRLQEAKEAAERAERELREARQQRSLVRQVAEALRTHRERNHFSEIIAESMRRNR